MWAYLCASTFVAGGALRSLRGLSLLEWFVRRGGDGKLTVVYTVESLFRDVLASAVVASLLIPQSMSYALLVGVPVEFGLYSAVTPTFMYSLFASVSCTQFGIVAPTSILANNIGTQLTGLADGLKGTPAQNQLFITTQIQLAFACGVIFAAMLVLRLSWVANFISLPVLNGYTWGSAGLIVASQLKDLFGYKPATNPTNFGGRMTNAVHYISKSNACAAVLGSLSLLILLYIKDIRVTFRGRALQLHKLTPVPLLLIILTCGISYGMDLNGRFGVSIVGTIPSELPPYVAPFSSDAAGASAFFTVLPQAVLLSIVGLVQTLGVGNAFVERRNEVVVPWREVAGSAAAHLVGCTFSSVTTSGSITRTAVAFDAGAATPMCGVFVGVIILVAIKFLTPFLKYLPMCVLAAVVTSSTRNLFDFAEMRNFWRGKLSDFLTMIFTVAMLLWLDVSYGLLAGIGFSMLTVLHRAFKPRVAEVGLLPGTECFVSIERFPAASRVPGVLVYRLDGEISFGNAQTVEDRLLAALGEALASPSSHAAGSVRGDGGKSESERGSSSDADGGGEAAPLPSRTVGLRMRACYALSSSSSFSNSLSAAAEGAAAASAAAAAAAPRAAPGPPAARVLPRPVHAVIFDCSRVVSVDVRGAKTFSTLIKAFQKKKVLLLLAALPGPVRDTLSRYGVCADAAPAPAAAGSGCIPRALAGCCGGGAGGGSAAGLPAAASAAPADATAARYLSVAAALVAAAAAASEAERSASSEGGTGSSSAVADAAPANGALALQVRAPVANQMVTSPQ
jgi:high affinity sulfate transporter 1